MKNHYTCTSKTIAAVRLTHFILCLLTINLILVLAGCNREALFEDSPPKPKPEPPPTLPPVTTSGKGTFGCRVNDTIWIPKQGGLMLPATTLQYFRDALNVRGYNSTEQQSLSISLSPVNNTGYYTFSELTTNSTSRVTFIPKNIKEMYQDQPVTEGYLNILRFDLQKGIVSGTFAFDAYNQYGDTVHITDGRFDLHF